MKNSNVLAPPRDSAPAGCSCAPITDAAFDARTDAVSEAFISAARTAIRGYKDAAAAAGDDLFTRQELLYILTEWVTYAMRSAV